MGIKKTQKEFINEAHSKFPHFDYSNTVYTSSDNFIEVKCPIHGTFRRRALNFLKSGTHLFLLMGNELT